MGRVGFEPTYTVALRLHTVEPKSTAFDQTRPPSHTFSSNGTLIRYLWVGWDLTPQTQTVTGVSTEPFPGGDYRGTMLPPTTTTSGVPT